MDIEYRIFNGPNMLSAETVVETMNRLTEGEMVSTLKYAVGRRSVADPPYSFDEA